MYLIYNLDYIQQILLIQINYSSQSSVDSKMIIELTQHRCRPKTNFKSRLFK
jgi:hypothetical protein